MFAFCSNALKAQFYFDHLTITEGLTHNTVYCMHQDQNGYIWIGTGFGLNRFNGYDLKVYNSRFEEESNTGFKGLHISSIFEDSKGNLWVGTKKMGINVKLSDSDKFTNKASEASFSLIKGFEVSSFYEDQRGAIWISTIGAGVLRYDPITQTSKIYNNKEAGLSSDIAFSILEDHNQVLWVATAGGGLNMLYPGSDAFTQSHEMLPNSPNLSGYKKTMCLDGGFIWLATQGTGVYKINLEDLSYERYSSDIKESGLSSNAAMDIVVDSKKRVFVSTDGEGLFSLDRAQNTFKPIRNRYRDRSSLNSDALLCLYMDQTDNLWIGSFNGGVNILKTAKVKFDFHSIVDNREGGSLSNSVLSIYEHSNGQLLVGTDGDGLYVYDHANKMVQLAHYNSSDASAGSISGDVVKTIYEDSKGRVWIGYFGAGLDVYDPMSNSFERIFEDGILSTANVWDIDELANGSILIATLGDGLFVYDPKIGIAQRLDQLEHRRIMEIFVDSSNRIWVGSAEGGLELIDAQGVLIYSFEHDRADSTSISDNAIRAVFEDVEGDIWVGTERGGLNLWMGQKNFKRYDESSGLLSNNVTGIAEDSLGILWVSGFKGVSSFDLDIDSISNYNFHNEKDANQFNQGALLVSQTKQILFGGIYGLNSIDPKPVKDEQKAYKLIFSDLKINNESVPVGPDADGDVHLLSPIENAESLYLDHRDHSLSIYFSNNDYAYQVDNKFAYKLEGFDPNWKYTKLGENSATYTNLDPGNYTLKLKYKNFERRLNINITPPVWQLLWFRILIFIVLVLVFLSLLNLWTQRKIASHKRELLVFKNERLETEIDQNNSKLMFTSVQMAQKNDVLKTLLKEIKLMKVDQSLDVRSLESKIKFELSNSDYWNEFNYYFSQVDKEFIKNLKDTFPTLTKNDLRIISLLRLNLSTKEIAALLNITVRAVEQARYRLKKRLDLPVNTDLGVYILSRK